MIAISYRREDSLPIAGRLYDRLQAKFGKKNVFMDFDSIPPGADFRQHIKQMIERSNLVIAIIGPHWLGEQPDASRRIDNPADFVRLEIAYALAGGIPVIPLLINTTQMPKPEMLPPDIQELAFRHALPLDSGMDFHSHADRLIAGIGKATDAARKRRHFVTDSEKPRPASPTTHVPRTSFGSEESKRKLITWTGSKLVVGTSVALLFAVAALTAWYVATHRREPPSAESAATAPLIVKPSVEQSVSPLPLGSQAPKEAALTTAPSPTGVEVLKAKRLESEEKAAPSPASTAVQTQRDSRPIYVVIASVSKTLNIRSDHSARSTIIEKLQPGDRVFLEDRRIRNDDPPHATMWQKVTTMNGATGWIDFAYLAPEQSSPPQLASEQPKSIVEQSSQPQITKAPTLDFASITKEQPYENSLGMKFVPVPGTNVLFGIWDTRVRDFRAYAEATTYRQRGGITALKVVKNKNGGSSTTWELDGEASWEEPGFSQSAEHPVVGVSWDEAKAFCAWLTETERKAGRLSDKQEYRLPTDAEWSTAVGDSKYPWGNKWPPPQGAGNYFDDAAVAKLPGKGWPRVPGNDGFARTSPVGSFRPNPLGLYDMGGNVWQWCEDWYRKEMNSKAVLDKYPILKDDGGGETFRVVRGASWGNNEPEGLLSSDRNRAPPDARDVNDGFRCVLGESEIVSTKDEKSSAPFESLSPNDTGAQKLTKVFVKKYGFSVLLPTDVFPEAAKLTTGEETQLIATDGLTTLEFYDSNESLAKNYRSRIADSAEAQGRTIEYKILKENWFVVSGKFGPDAKHAANMGFYTKAVKKGPKVIFMHLRYKEEDPLISDEVLTAMSRSFDGN